MTTRVPIAALALILGLAPWTPAQSDATEPLQAYLRARDAKSVGEVAGRAIGDGPRPSAPPTPYEGVSILLLPTSPELQAELDAIKAHARDSLKRYMDVTVDVTEAREHYERVLLAAGAGELIRGEVTDATGLARLIGVPEGDWLLIAWRSQSQAAKTPRLRREEASAFRDITVSGGYSILSYWLMRVAVRPGAVSEVELNDRNVWLTGVREDVHRIEATPKSSSKKRR